jgi:hypothetical protein
MAKKERFPSNYVDIEALKKVEFGKELKGLSHCYHIETKYHPNCPSKIPLENLSDSMRLKIIGWIRKGRIFIE